MRHGSPWRRVHEETDCPGNPERWRDQGCSAYGGDNTPSWMGPAPGGGRPPFARRPRTDSAIGVFGSAFPISPRPWLCSSTWIGNTDARRRQASCVPSHPNGSIRPASRGCQSFIQREAIGALRRSSPIPARRTSLQDQGLGGGLLPSQLRAGVAVHGRDRDARPPWKDAASCADRDGDCAAYHASTHAADVTPTAGVEQAEKPSH